MIYGESLSHVALLVGRLIARVRALAWAGSVVSAFVRFMKLPFRPVGSSSIGERPHELP